MMKMMTQERVSVDLQRRENTSQCSGLWSSASIQTFFSEQASLRRLSEPHGVVTFAHDLVASSVHELGQPSDAPYEEAGIDIKEDDGGVAVGILPVGKKRSLGGKRGKEQGREDERDRQCSLFFPPGFPVSTCYRSLQPQSRVTPHLFLVQPIQYPAIQNTFSSLFQ